ARRRGPPARVTAGGAGDQAPAAFLRRVSASPRQGTDVRDTFFSRQRPPSEADPGRLYLGICSPGRRLKVALIRVYVAFLSAAQQLYERYGKAADPWMSLVGYFNSMRELGGMRRLVDDDVKSRLRRMDKRGLARRVIDTVDELASRRSPRYWIAGRCSSTLSWKASGSRRPGRSSSRTYLTGPSTCCWPRTWSAWGWT